MVDPTNGDLAPLTSALDEPGTELQAAVTAFAGHLAAAVPSLLGVTITLVLDGDDVALSIQDTDLTSIPNACMTVPFKALITNDATDSTMVFHAGDVDAFADLAVAVPRSVDTGGPIPTCRQMAPLSSGHALDVTGLAEFSKRNQAIGVLIDQGYLPDEARLELRRRATQHRPAVNDTVQHTLDHLTPATNRTGAARAGTLGARLSTHVPRPGAAPGADLTARERDVLRLLVGGLSTAAIAAALLVPPRTVSDHFHAIRTKLGANSRVETVAITLNNDVLGSG